MAYLLQILVVLVISPRIKLGADKQITQLTPYMMISPEQKCFFINESGFYSLTLSSKQPKAKEFKHWVTSKVLPSIRKYGYYDSKSNKLLIETENDLHCKVV